MLHLHLERGPRHALADIEDDHIHVLELVLARADGVDRRIVGTLHRMRELHGRSLVAVEDRAIDRGHGRSFCRLASIARRARGDRAVMAWRWRQWPPCDAMLQRSLDDCLLLERGQANRRRGCDRSARMERLGIVQIIRGQPGVDRADDTAGSTGCGWRVGSAAPVARTERMAGADARDASTASQPFSRSSRAPEPGTHARSGPRGPGAGGFRRDLRAVGAMPIVGAIARHVRQRAGDRRGSYIHAPARWLEP